MVRSLVWPWGTLSVTSPAETRYVNYNFMVKNYMLNSKIDVARLTGFMVSGDLSFVLPQRETLC